jgi:hypothetical protein
VERGELEERPLPPRVAHLPPKRRRRRIRTKVMIILVTKLEMTMAPRWHR